MSHSVVAKWGKNLAIREARARARQDAEAAADEIIADSRRHSLGGVSIRELPEDGRPG